LYDNVLPGFQHFADELRTARGPGMAVMMAVVTRTAGTAAFETVAPGTAPSIVTATRTAITAVTAVASTTLRALEAGARIATDACGLAELFAGSTGNTRSASLAWKKNFVLRDRRSLAKRLAGSSFDQLGLVFGVLVFVRGVFRFVRSGFESTKGSSVLGGFLGGVGL
jgi:hypothetical protein